jgi:Uncharacterised protein family UPF0547
MSPVTRPPTAAPAQRVCPSCARIAHTDARRCPFCGHGYRRRTLAWVAVMLVVFAVGILGGVAAMLAAFGDRLETELDTRVTTVQRELDQSVGQIGDDVRGELDRRLPQTGSATP